MFTSGQPTRNATPSRTAKRRSVTGSPDDARRSLLRHVPEEALIREEPLLECLAKPRTEYVIQEGDVRASLFPEVPNDPRWRWEDPRPLRERSRGGTVIGDARDDKQSTTSKVLDPAVAAALENERERIFLLALEENIISGLQDSSIDRIELTTPIPKDLQSLVGHLAEYYGLKSEVAESSEEDAVNMTLL